MCVSCRKRAYQKELIRLQKNGDTANIYSGSGRSFYICKDCIKNDKHILNKISGRLKINITSLEEVIKELRSNDEN
jgi:predicted RNA-binding protein YlxR (DUF448 family)